MKRIMFGGLLGGFVLFAWSFIAHLPPVGDAGYRLVRADREDALITALRSTMLERAIYVLPRIDSRHPMTTEAQQAWIVKYDTGPAAVVVYDPHPGARSLAGSVFAGQIIIELTTAILAALIGAAIALHLSATLGYWPRVCLVWAIGILATIDIDASYWSWYGYPTSFLLAQFVDHGGGWLLAGLVIARVCRPGAGG